MKGRIVASLARGYLAAALLAAALLGSGVQSGVALGVLLLHGLQLYRPLPPRFDLLVTVMTLLLMAPLYTPLVGSLMAVLLVAPGLALLDRQLRELDPPARAFRKGMRSSPQLQALAGLFGAAAGWGVVGGAPSLLGAASLLAGVLGVRVAQELWALRGAPLHLEPRRLRLLAGTQGSISLEVLNSSSLVLRVTASAAHPWVSLRPQEFSLGPGQGARLHLTVVPPQAGPLAPVVRLGVRGPWGLLATGYELTPLELHGIPRARYAAWLARRYLRAFAGGPSAGAAARPPPLGGRGRGVEYHGLRQYQPGDRLRDIDWRHTLNLSELVIRERLNPLGGPVTLLVNLVVRDVHEADWSAYHLVMVALTAAHEGVPVSIVAYTQDQVTWALRAGSGREAVKAALRLAAGLVLRPPLERLLDPPNVLRLRRSLRRLTTDGTGEAVSLPTLLRLELISLEEQARRHPVASSVQTLVRRVPPDAVVTVVSHWNHDVEALAVMLPWLQSRGYRIVDLQSHREARWTS